MSPASRFNHNLELSHLGNTQVLISRFSGRWLLSPRKGHPGQIPSAVIGNQENLLDAAGYGLVLEDPNDNTAILRLPFRRLLIAYLLVFAHRSRNEHPGEGDTALLN